mgnify:CR=1 FL=1
MNAVATEVLLRRPTSTSSEPAWGLGFVPVPADAPGAGPDAVPLRGGALFAPPVVPADRAGSVPAALVLILTALQQALWRALARRHGVPRPGTAMMIGMVASSVAFALLAAVAATHGAGTPRPLVATATTAVSIPRVSLGGHSRPLGSFERPGASRFCEVHHVEVPLYTAVSSQ